MVASTLNLRRWPLAALLLTVALCAASPAEPLRGAAPSSADEIVLMFRREPRCQSQVVRVGDLIEVAGSSDRTLDDLLEIPLAPAPQIGVAQEWTAEDVLRHLQLRGLSQRRLRWSGPRSVKLFRVAESAVELDRTQLAPAFVQDRTLAQAEANLAQAAREYLWLKTGERTQWRITAKVPTEHAQALSQRRNIQTIGGGTAPWIGEQELLVGYVQANKPFEISVPVTIELPPTIVVTTRPMRRDEVIDESALAYGPLPERMDDQAEEYFTDFAQLVGKQLRRSMSTGLPIPRSAIGEPIVVSSGELIEVESVAGTISVKTAARALSGGAVGDLINIELLSTRKRLAATVVGPLQVRIAGGAPVSGYQNGSSQGGLKR
ncbi:MAG: flagellar basal body P-ring formation chaperone FlgA [Aureliella sp.]